MSYENSDKDMQKYLKDWNAKYPHNKATPDRRDWKWTIFGWVWIGKGKAPIPRSGRWVTYRGERRIQTAIQEYDYDYLTVYIWEGPEPKGGRPPRPDLTPEEKSARAAQEMKEKKDREAYFSPQAVAKRERLDQEEERKRLKRLAEIEAAQKLRIRQREYNSCTARFGQFQSVGRPTSTSGGTRKKRKNRDTKKTRSRRYTARYKSQDYGLAFYI